jgi:hypothetical protein
MKQVLLIALIAIVAVWLVIKFAPSLLGLSAPSSS